VFCFIKMIQQEYNPHQIKENDPGKKIQKQEPEFLKHDKL